MTVSTALKRLRKELGLRQADLAEALGVTTVTINRWEMGKNPPNRAMSMALLSFAAKKNCSRVTQSVLKEALFVAPKVPGMDDLHSAEIEEINDLVNQSTNAVFVCDAQDYSLLYANHKLGEITDQNTESAKGKTCYQYIFHRDTPCYDCPFKGPMKDEKAGNTVGNTVGDTVGDTVGNTAGDAGSFIEREYYCKRTDRYYVCRSKKTEWNGKSAFIEYITDVTELYKVKQELSIKQEETDKNRILSEALKIAENATRSKEEFLAHLNREIATPINTIMGMTDIAKESFGDYRQMTNCLNQIEVASHFLLTLMNDVMEVSKIAGGDFEIINATFSIGVLLAGIRDVVEPLAMKRGVRYQCDSEVDMNALYTGDATRLHQVLVQLLSNSIKFTNPQGRVRFSVEIVEEKKKFSTFRFKIQDTGIGMSSEFMKHMFEPFTQEDMSNTKRFNGSGLGLPIAKDLTEAMGGTLEVESFSGIGSTFTVTIPVERKHISGEPSDGISLEDEVVTGGSAIAGWDNAGSANAGRGNAGSAIAGSGNAGSANAKYGNAGELSPWDHAIAISKSGGLDEVTQKLDKSCLRGAKILVVENHPIDVMVIWKLLESQGASVDVVENGKVAIERFMESEQDFYDAILMDIRMPVMDGYEATARIRAMEREDARRIPIIAVTSKTQEEDSGRSYQVGMSAVLFKPIMANELYQTLVLQIAED